MKPALAYTFSNGIPHQVDWERVAEARGWRRIPWRGGGVWALRGVPNRLRYAISFDDLVERLRVELAAEYRERFLAQRERLEAMGFGGFGDMERGR